MKLLFSSDYNNTNTIINGVVNDYSLMQIKYNGAVYRLTMNHNGIFVQTGDDDHLPILKSSQQIVYNYINTTLDNVWLRGVRIKGIGILIFFPNYFGHLLNITSMKVYTEDAAWHQYDISNITFYGVSEGIMINNGTISIDIEFGKIYLYSLSLVFE